jgi:hypothetical protein
MIDLSTRLRWAAIHSTTPRDVAMAAGWMAAALCGREAGAIARLLGTIDRQTEAADLELEEAARSAQVAMLAGDLPPRTAMKIVAKAWLRLQNGR